MRLLRRAARDLATSSPVERICLKIPLAAVLAGADSVTAGI
jgi:hypothetical protein